MMLKSAHLGQVGTSLFGEAISFFSSASQLSFISSCTVATREALSWRDWWLR